jgi:signal transduction histidine kinase
MKRIRRLDLQAKISLVLATVILPTFVLVTLAQNQLTQPILEDEMRQVGITSARRLAAEVVGQRYLSLANPTPAIERHLQEFLYSQPNIMRLDVVVRDPVSGLPRLIASNVEEEPGVTPSAIPKLVDTEESQYRFDDELGLGIWDISVPIEQRSRDPRGPRRILGSVHVVLTTKLANQITEALWKITASAAGLSVILLIVLLSYFLRKTIANDRKLRQAESQNLMLAEQLHDAQRQLMNTEKLAVMGQLTASFAHEIGTPLNAIGGHLQLLREEIDASKAERVDIINSQVSRIEQIVKNFLQSTAKPSSQTQLVDLNRLADQTLSFVRPRCESVGVEVRRDYDRAMGPVRVVPLDLEQILLNLVNNSLDALTAKGPQTGRARSQLEVSTRVDQEGNRQWAVVSVYDTGEGITKEDMSNILKPFFTTKRPGEGTGLGLNICQELARKYGGVLEIDSKHGAWTRVTLRIPYHA